MNFCKRSYQPILRYLYTETIKRGGEISLHKHFKVQIHHRTGNVVLWFIRDKPLVGRKLKFKLP